MTRGVTSQRSLLQGDLLTPDLLAAVLASEADAVVFSDAAGRVRWASPSVVELFGWEPDEFVLVGPHLSHPDDDAEFASALATLHASPGHHRLGSFRQLGADGDWHRFDVTGINLLADHGLIMTRFRPVSNTHDASPRPQHLDEVTGLPRRIVVRGELEKRLAAATNPVAVLFLDLDGFKSVNDRFGHCAGDRVLREVTDRLRTRLRETELLARWGGDEFVVLVDVPGQALATTVAARLHAAITEHAYDVDGESVHLGVSIGVALSSSGPADRLVRAADQAMYEAKRAGGGIVAAPMAA